jgi:hypothetical protein
VIVCGLDSAIGDNAAALSLFGFGLGAVSRATLVAAEAPILECALMGAKADLTGDLLLMGSFMAQFQLSGINDEEFWQFAVQSFSRCFT